MVHHIIVVNVSFYAELYALFLAVIKDS